MSLIPLGFWAASGGGGAGAFDLLETTTLTSSASSVTFSGLGAYSDYKHLQIRMVLRSQRTGSVADTWGIRFNGVSTTSYVYHRLRGFNSSVSSLSNTGMTIMDTGSFTTADSVANAFGVSVIDILDFSSVNKNTTIRNLNGMTVGTSNVDRVHLNSGFYNSTDAITSVSLQSSQGFDAAVGSRFSLYGIRG